MGSHEADADRDPVERVWDLVDDTLTQLLRPGTTVDEDACVSEAFLIVLTSGLAPDLAVLSGRASPGDPCTRAAAGIAAAVEHIRAGRVPDARDELIGVRGALRQLRPATPPPALEDRCDLCERARPRWRVPIRGGMAMPNPTLRVGFLLACQGCLDAVADTHTDAQLADLLGFDDLPRPLRGLHARLAGQPRAWASGDRLQGELPPQPG